MLGASATLAEGDFLVVKALKIVAPHAGIPCLEIAVATVAWLGGICIPAAIPSGPTKGDSALPLLSPRQCTLDRRWAPAHLLFLFRTDLLHLTEINGTRHLGSIRALTVAIMVFATAVGPGLTGFLIDREVSYPGQIIAMGVYCICISFVMLYVSGKVRGRAALSMAEPSGTPRT